MSWLDTWAQWQLMKEMIGAVIGLTGVLIFVGYFAWCWLSDKIGRKR